MNAVPAVVKVKVGSGVSGEQENLWKSGTVSGSGKGVVESHAEELADRIPRGVGVCRFIVSGFPLHVGIHSLKEWVGLFGQCGSNIFLAGLGVLQKDALSAEGQCACKALRVSWCVNDFKERCYPL